MKYVMITKFVDHWDNIPNGKTSYGVGFLKGNMRENKLQENTETLFIKKEKDKAMSKAWRGFISNIRREVSNGQKQIYFSVTIREQMDFPEKYRKWSEGWYLEEFDASKFIPPFFQEISDAEDWAVFEELTASLLRIVGINDVYPYEKDNQKGRPDGVFVFRNMVVIYDCTLDRNYEDSKETQIENYINLLRPDRLNIHKKIVTIKDFDKRVWIITKNKRKDIIQVDDIIVKEIPVRALQQLYISRMTDNVNAAELENKLLEL
jgi:hypothetical protein